MNYYRLMILALMFPITSSGAGLADLLDFEPPSRIVLERDEDGKMRPVAGSPGPEALFQEASSGAPRRILIGLRTPFGADEVNLYGPDGPELYREYAQQARREFLNELYRHHPELDELLIEELEEIPYLALFPTEARLDFVLHYPDVISVNTESGGEPQLNATIPFVGADTAHGLGHDGTWQTIAIIDTGVDRTHPMFSGKVVSEACYSSTAYSPQGNLCRAGSYGSTGPNTGGACTLERDPCTAPYICDTGELHCHPGHGSHVAGIAAGRAVFPGGGVPSLKGVAHGAHVISLMPLSFVESTALCGAIGQCIYYLETSVAAALNRVYALRNTHNISAVNLSLMLSGFPFDYSASTCDSSWPAVRDAVALLRNAGIQVYAASGNAGGQGGYQNKIGPPACLSKVISVAATHRNADVFAYYANAAGILDILAPGGDGAAWDPTTPTCRDTGTLTDGIWSAYFQTNCADDYFRDVGTSMATPHASGAHALLRSRYPQASETAISDWMVASGVPVSFWQAGVNYTKPRIDLAAAMTPPPAPASGPPAGVVNWLLCFGHNEVFWDTVPGAVSEYHLQGVTSNWMYYRGSLTNQLIHVSQTEHLRVRACSTVSCGPWTTIGQATYQPVCH